MTESVERAARIDLRGACLEPQQRGDGLQVVLDAVVDLLGEHAAHHRAPVLERDCGVVRDRLEQGAIVVGERRVAVANELADLPPLPPQRQAQRVSPGAALGPRDLAVLEHERGAGRPHRGDRRLHDRLERLLQIQRLGDGLRDLRERLELVHPPLRVGVELRVLDRLRDLRRDRDEQVDLGLGVLARARVRTLSAPSSFSRARIGTARIDSYSSSGRFGNCLKRESRCADDGDHHRRTLRRRGPR